MAEIVERLRTIPDLIDDCKAVADNFRNGHRHEPPTNAALWDRMHRELSAAYAVEKAAIEQKDQIIAGLKEALEDLLAGCVALDREQNILPQQMQKARRALSEAASKAREMVK